MGPRPLQAGYGGRTSRFCDASIHASREARNLRWCSAGKTLVVAEKPSVARDLADALPGTVPVAERGLPRVRRHVITCAVGHLVELKEPEDYDEKFKKWRMDDLPIVPERLQAARRATRKSKKQLNVIHKLMQRDDVDRVVNACDAGREGELIFAYIYELAGRRQARRPALDQLDDEAGDPRRLREAPPGRPSWRRSRRRRAPASEADWLVGMNATRAATIRGRAWVGGVVSLGRVQTPTLAMIVKREREIQAFVPEPYWLVHADASTRATQGIWFEGDETRIFGDPERAPSDRRRRSPARTASSSRSSARSRSESAPLLYDLTSLQRDANGRFGFCARRTLQAAQSLYEGKKAITYPRTSSPLPLRRPRPAAEADRRDARSRSRDYAQARAVRPRPRRSCR